MLAINPENAAAWNIRMRPMFANIIKDLVQQREDVVLVVADSGRACRISGFPDQPHQFVDCGIAEQNMTSVAAGLARCGKRPVTFAFAPFASERCFEQIRVDVAYSNLPVIIVGSEGGVSMGTQGVTHFGWEDIAVMRSLPGMTVLCPADNAELVQCMRAALDLKGPAYIRLGGGVPAPVYTEEYLFTVGKGIVHKTGEHIHIVASGPPVGMALQAAERLAEQGIGCGVVDLHTIKPLDEELIVELANKAPLMLSIEEHSLVGGLGSAVADVLATSATACRLLKMGLPDRYPATVSPYPEMMQQLGLTVEHIVANALQAVRQLSPVQ